MDKVYKSIAAAMIFASDEPLPASEILKGIKDIDGDDVEISKADIENGIKELNEEYESYELPFNIINVANGYVFATKPEYATYVGYLSTEKSKRRLTQASLETLAIIAYKQPITKPEVESIRGVNSDYIINSLLEKNLITIKGRAETIGRPLLYETTDEFLKYFGLASINDLPKPREINEIMKDEDFVEQKRKIMMNQLEENITKEEEENDDESSSE